MTPDRDLLARYAADGSRDAFGELAARYLDMVYAAARRQVGGDTALAEDITQAVFLMFARKAPALREDAIVPAWLLRATWYASRNAVRLGRRRRIHEARAAAMNSRSMVSSAGQTASGDADDASTLSAILDRALMSLRERDRAAVAMHYLRGQTFEQVAAALGTTPEAARKRIERAIVKLRDRFAATTGTRSITPAAVTSALIAAAKMQAPATLLSAASNAATGTPVSTVVAIADGGLRAMTMLNAKLACAAALAIAVLAASVCIVVPRRSNIAATAGSATTARTPTTATAAIAPAAAAAAAAGPLDALRRLAATVRDGDGDAAKSVAAITDPADRAFLDLAAENIRLAGLFRSAYRDAFGADAADALAPAWYPSGVPDSARVNMNAAGDRATVVLPEGTVPMVRVDGQWKVPSSFITVENQGGWRSSSPQALQLVRLNNLAYAEAIHAIGQGRIKSPEQARDDLRDRLRRAKAAAARSPSTTARAPAQPAGP